MDPTGELAVERLATASTGELVELAREGLGEGHVPRTPGFWDWKHRVNPFGESIGTVARGPDGLAGMRPFMRWSWRDGDGEHPAVRAVDTATHPDWRRRGIFRELTEAALEEAEERGVRFVFNTPNDRSLPGYLKMGWRRVGRIPVRVRPFRPLRSAVRLVRSRLRSGAPAVGSPPAGAGEVLDSTDLGTLLASWHPEARLHTPRTREYLLWRYGSVPDLAYGAGLEGDVEAGALAVYRLRRRHGLAELMICELLVAPGAGSADAGARLLRRLRAETDADYAVAVAASGTPESRVLRRAGFLRIPRLGPVLTVRSVRTDVQAAGLLRWDRWRLTVGDVELF